jgi:hypothetical protein
MLAFPIEAFLRGAVVVLQQEYVSVDDIDADRSLFITDLRVVNDAGRTSDGCPENDSATNPSGDGVWTFGYLMKKLGGAEASKFVLDWLRTWETDQTINGFTVAARPEVEIIISRWQSLSGGPTAPLDMSKAPFRLLAIVLRTDLAGNAIYGATSAGELRFVFGAVGWNCMPMEATVILEYGVNAASCLTMKEWARKWVDLASFTPGQPDYNDRLELLTEAVVAPAAGSALSGGLNQVRSNESVFFNLLDEGTPFWDLREFKLDGASPALVQKTVAQTPDLSLNGEQVIADYVNAHAPAIRASTDIVPPTYPGTSPFLGGSALMVPASGSEVGTFWSGPTMAAIADPEARFSFSLHTCNGCHAGETATGGFHVDPRQPQGVEATRSDFLEGGVGPVPDPTGVMVGGKVLEHWFADIDLRRQDLARFATQDCVFWVLRDIRLAPPIFTH